MYCQHGYRTGLACVTFSVTHSVNRWPWKYASASVRMTTDPVGLLLHPRRDPDDPLFTGVSVENLIHVPQHWPIGCLACIRLEHGGIPTEFHQQVEHSYIRQGECVIVSSASAVRCRETCLLLDAPGDSCALWAHRMSNSIGWAIGAEWRHRHVANRLTNGAWCFSSENESSFKKYITITRTSLLFRLSNAFGRGR